MKQLSCEIIFSRDMIHHGLNILERMRETAPVDVEWHEQHYTGTAPLLMTYGIGEPMRGRWFKEHTKSGRHAIAWDQAYFKNTAKFDWRARAMRVSIDANHPQRWMDDRPSDRWDALGIKLREDYDPDGPIVLVGLGPKQNAALNQPKLTWETPMLARIREAYPKTKVIYRPKREDRTVLPDTKRMFGMSIEEVLKGASLVVCRHSNVAIDACVAGIPVVCEDGAAAALYGHDLAHPVKPTREERLRFLHKLAYFQWLPTEGKECWQFLLGRLKKGLVQ